MENHLPHLISDLGLILITAAVVSLIFKKIKQPLVLGYIIAGFVVSPYLPFTPSVGDKIDVEIWAEIGVIFLLFGLGLEFSFKKLLKEGGTTIVTAIFKITAMLAVGYLVGRLLGWDNMNSLFLGGMLASSSTLIILKSLEELSLKTRNFARTVIGILIIEDIVVVLLMVLLSTIAITKQVEGGELLFTVLKLGFFLILWFIMGISLIPTLLKRAKKMLDEEVLLILSIGLCLGMAILATNIGFSAELGAFVMGSILAETMQAEKIEHLMKPVKNLFGAIFFVSIGMMIDPVTIWEYKWIILLITVLTIVGKLVFTIIGAVISGQSLKQSVQVGMSMAQISEFAFIVATLGMSLGVISKILFPIAVGAAVITTFTTPYMIKYADNAFVLIEKILPKKWLHLINLYTSRADNPKSETETKKLIKKIFTIVFINGIIAVAIALFFALFLLPMLNAHLPAGILPEIIVLVLGLLFLLPFLWAMIFKLPSNMSGGDIINNKDYNRRTFSFIEIIRIVLGMAVVWFLADICFGTRIAVLVVIPLVFVVLFVFSNGIKIFYKKIERHFIINFNSREIAAAEQAAPMSNISKRLRSNNTSLSNWDVHLTNLEAPQHAEYIGRTLKELQWREKFGINVVYVKRGERIIYSPGPNVKILPFDNVGVFASDEILEKFKTTFFAEQQLEVPDIDVEDIVVEKICIYEDNPLMNKTIRDSGIRETTGGIVVAIERDSKRILTPAADLHFREMDIVWIVGEKKRVKVLK
jgi:CPA2 family monovalent cation:H+ antiporter-2